MIDLKWMLGLWFSAALIMWGSIWAYVHTKLGRDEATSLLSAHASEDLRAFSALREALQSSNQDKDREFSEIVRMTNERFNRLEDRWLEELHRIADGQDQIRTWLLDRGKS